MDQGKERERSKQVVKGERRKTGGSMVNRWRVWREGKEGKGR